MTKINLRNFFSFQFDIKIILANIILIVVFFSIYPYKQYEQYVSYINIIPTNDRIDIINFDNINTFIPLSSSYKKYELNGQIDYISRSTIKYSTKIKQLQEDYVQSLKQSLNHKIKVLSYKFSIDLKQNNILFSIEDYDKRKFFLENKGLYDFDVKVSSKLVDNRVKILIILIFLTIIVNILIFATINIIKFKS
tara:strand:- start:2685 stop:3266 length:582 start_codon:yes stop_codon:yes gene_type:complete